MSAQKAADELHLDGWVIDALESGDYARIGPTVYGKGHLRHYAALLGLPAAEILEAYDAQSSAPVEPPAPPPATLRVRTAAPAGAELPWAQIAGFAAVALVIAGGLWLRPWHRHAPTSTPAAELAADGGRSAAPRDLPAVPGADAMPDGAVAPGVVAAPPPTAAKAVAGSGAKTGASSAPAGVPADANPNAGFGRARLRLSFSADSWVDVRDALGQRVFAGNGRANSVKTIAGAAPLRVYLKTASGVQLEINNRAVAIGSQFVVGNAARFEAGADGVLRRDTHAPPPPSGAAAAPRPRG